MDFNKELKSVLEREKEPINLERKTGPVRVSCEMTITLKSIYISIIIYWPAGSAGGGG